MFAGTSLDTAKPKPVVVEDNDRCADWIRDLVDERPLDKVLEQEFTERCVCICECTRIDVIAEDDWTHT